MRAEKLDARAEMRGVLLHGFHTFAVPPFTLGGPCVAPTPGDAGSSQDREPRTGYMVFAHCQVAQE